MRILTKYKDYYDYMQGVDGIDPLAVFDRRKSYFFDDTIDAWHLNIRSRNPDTYYDTFGILSGDTLYFIGETIGEKISEGLNEYYKLKYKLIEKVSVKNEKEEPLMIVNVHKTYDYKTKQIHLTWSYPSSFKGYPNFSRSSITGLIPAEEMFRNIQDFILSRKEKKLVDNRTDVQKIEAAGFDKKTSFRNC